MSEEKVVGVYEAKTQLPRLLDSVEGGETVTITRHGRPVAKLVPIEEPVKKRSVEEILEEAREFRKTHTLGRDGQRWSEFLHEGHKY